MDENDRTKILRNLVQLMRVQNVAELHSELISRQVFTPDMIETISATGRNPKEQLQKLFIETCKRGPNAFGHLVDALGNSGNLREAQLLDRSYNNPHPRRIYEDENENAVEEQEVIGRHLDEPASPPVLRRQPEPDEDEYGDYEDPSDPSEHNMKYSLKSHPKGYALIVNVIDFEGNPSLKRVGAEKDSNRLSTLLNSLGYEVTLVINPKKKDLLCPKTGILKRFTDKFTFEPVDSCIVSIMSHGEDNFWFQTSDCENIGNDTAHLIQLWEDVLPRFNNQYFPTMRDKPKIFIIQSCRGEKYHKRIEVTPISTTIRRSSSLQFDSTPKRQPILLENHPEFNHMMILQSTLPGYVSVRHELNGSPFIQILCNVVKTYAKKLTIIDMIPIIAKKLQDLPSVDGGPQTCTFKTVGYVKKFQFQ